MTAFDSNTYCDFNASAANSTAGKNLLLCFFDSTGANLLALCGQKSFSLSLEADDVDVSSKDTLGGWGATISGTKSWSISCDGIVVKGTEDRKALLKAFMEDKTICVKVVEESGAGVYSPLYGGLMSVTTYEEEAPHDDAWTYSAELSGIGKPWIAEIASTEETAAASAVPSNRVDG